MTLSDYENALKSFIHDDDKLVTYKWISKEFEIHVNVAKDLLKQYWEKNKNDESINATFLLMGQLTDGSIRVEVVKESNLTSAKEKFTKVDCEHLYSLQKSLEDVELLAGAGEGDLRFSAIKCNEKFLRNEEEVESLRYFGNVRKEEPKSVGNNKVSSKVPEKQESKNNTVSTKEKESKKVDANREEKAKNDKKKGETEKEKSKEKKKPEPKSETKSSPTEKKVEKKVSPPSKSGAKSNSKAAAKKPVQSKQSGFNNLFGKVQAKPQVSNKPKEDDSDSNEKKTSLSERKEKEETKVKEDKKVEKSERKEKEETKVKEDKKVEQKEKENSQEKENRNEQLKKEKKSTPKAENKVVSKSKSKSTKDARGQKRNRSQESNTASKRKRIIIADSSDDESNKSNEEEEEEPMEVVEEPPRVARKRSPSPPAEKRENGKRMVRKTIDKTFKDEDGYLVTKRVHVYEAVSDNEEVTEVKKEEPKKAKTESKVDAKKKQTTLMSFFKKS